MDPMLIIRHTEDRHRQPLAIVRNLPGLDAELRPAQLRDLGNALLRAADDCERLAAEGRKATSAYALTDPIEP